MKKLLLAIFILFTTYTSVKAQNEKDLFFNATLPTACTATENIQTMMDYTKWSPIVSLVGDSANYIQTVWIATPKSIPVEGVPTTWMVVVDYLDKGVSCIVGQGYRFSFTRNTINKGTEL